MVVNKKPRRKSKKSLFWQFGHRAAICRIVGLKPHHLHEILYRKRQVEKVRALELESASAQVLPAPIPMVDWLLNRQTTHPAFFGEPETNAYLPAAEN